jgi:RimJ/RimL family protein N-acetyltransferase
MIPRTTRLIDSNIILCPLEVGDATAIVEAVQESIAEIMPWMGWCGPNYNLDFAQAWLNTLPGSWENGTQYGLAITNAEDNKILGGTGLNHINPVIGWQTWGIGSGPVQPGTGSQPERRV